MSAGRSDYWPTNRPRCRSPRYTREATESIAATAQTRRPPGTWQSRSSSNQHETDPEYLEHALFDVRRALIGLEREIARVVTVQTGEASWDEPENSHTLVRLTIPVTIVYTDTYGG